MTVFHDGLMRQPVFIMEKKAQHFEGNADEGRPVHHAEKSSDRISVPVFNTSTAAAAHAGDDRSSSYLPCDVLDVTLAMLCAPPISGLSCPVSVTPLSSGGGKNGLVCVVTDATRIAAPTDMPFRCVVRVAAAEQLEPICGHIPTGTMAVQSPPDVWKALLRYFRGVHIRMDLCANIREIGDRFMFQFESVTELDLRKPPALTAVGDHFLYECTSLTHLTLPNGLERVGESFVILCTRLQAVDFQCSTKLRAVGGSFMYGCASLRRVCLPDTVTSTGPNFLMQCPYLTEVACDSPAIQSLLPKSLRAKKKKKHRRSP